MTTSETSGVRGWFGTFATVMGNSFGQRAGVDFNRIEGELQTIDGGTAPARAATVLSGLPQAARGDRQRAFTAASQPHNAGRLRRAHVRTPGGAAAPRARGAYGNQQQQDGRPLATHTTAAALTSATGHAVTHLFQRQQRTEDDRAGRHSYFVDVRTLLVHPDAKQERMAGLAAAAIDEFEFVRERGLPKPGQPGAYDFLGSLVLLF